MGYNTVEIITVVGSYDVPDGWNNILVIPDTSVTITNATGSAVFSSPISFGKNAGGNDSWWGFTITGDCTVIRNGDSVVSGASGGGGGGAAFGSITGLPPAQTNLQDGTIQGAFTPANSIVLTNDTFKTAFEKLQGQVTNRVTYIGTNYIIINANGIATVNGTALISGLSSAYTLSPNGVALSATNRATVFLLDGVYDLGAAGLPVSNFVDIVGLSKSGNNIITSTSGTGTIQVANSNNYSLSNITVNNTGAGRSISLNASQTDNGRWESIVLNKATVDSNISWAGTYNKITATVNDVLRGNILGTVSNSSFIDNSCGSSGSSVTVSGLIENCTAGANSFGASTNTTTISGIIRNCIASSDNCFGRSTNGCTISGQIENCTMNGSGNGFGYADFGTVTISGKMKNCIASMIGGGATFASLFNGNASISGTIENCTAGLYAYGYADLGASISISGTIKNCTSESYSFGSTGGSVPVSVSGTIENCTGTTECLKTTVGTIKNFTCSSLQFGGSHSGIFDRCTIGSGGMVIASGAIVRYSVIYGLIGAGGGAINAKLYLNSLDQDYDPLITNDIAVPYNVIDSNI